MKTMAEGRHHTAFCRRAPRQLRPVLLLLTLFACHLQIASLAGQAPAHVAPDAPDAAARRALGERIAGILHDPALEHGTWGIAIRSLDRAETLYELQPGRLLMPASTLKVVTLATAAERLGWDYTYTTSLSADGRIEDGVLYGDLVVEGSGDPTFDDWDGNATAVFADWATRLKAAGIRRITGRIVGDDNVFDDEGLGAGWMWDDLADSYSAPVGGLQFNQNSAQLIISGPVTTKSAPSVALRPVSAPVALINRLRSSAAGPPLDVHVTPRGQAIELTGSVPFGANATRNVAVANPTLYFVGALKATLAANGIEVQGDAADIDDIPSRVAASDTATTMIRIAEHRSPPLSAMAATMMQLSQNLFAETLLKTLAVTRDEAGRVSAAGTVSGGLAIESELLATWGVPAGEVSVVDGSGLSRYNLTTANALASVLAHVHHDERLRGPFEDALPAPGSAGTLQRRLLGTPAAGRVRAKTGSFTNARAMAGFVRTADDEPLVFVLIANNYGVPGAMVDAVVDRILRELAVFTRR